MPGGLKKKESKALRKKLTHRPLAFEMSNTVHSSHDLEAWTITRAEKIQVSMFLPNEHSMDDWYTAVYALPTVWPDVSMMGINNLRKVVGYDFHHMRNKYGVPGMWGNVRPRYLGATGWYTVAEREERLFTNRSNQPGDDRKYEVRTDDDWHAWRIWSTTTDRLWRLHQPGPLLQFPCEEGILTCIYDQVREEEHVILELVSPFHHDRSWTFVGVSVCLWGGVVSWFCF